MRHGPHHVAQKSTTASPSCFSISCSKFVSVTATAFDMRSSFLPRELHCPANRSVLCAVLAPAPLALTGHRLQESSHPLRGARIGHIGIAVRTLDELLPFFRDVLGMPIVPLSDADGARIVGLGAGDSLVELLE